MTKDIRIIGSMAVLMSELLEESKGVNSETGARKHVWEFFLARLEQELGTNVLVPYDDIALGLRIPNERIYGEELVKQLRIEHLTRFFEDRSIEIDRLEILATILEIYDRQTQNAKYELRYFPRIQREKDQPVPEDELFCFTSILTRRHGFSVKDESHTMANIYTTEGEIAQFFIGPPNEATAEVHQDGLGGPELE
jgi:hypothetical protein